MVVVMRFRSAGGDIAEQLEVAREALAGCRGYVSGVVGRNVDDPQLWTLVTHWSDTGSYRRALSSYDVRLRAVQVLSQALEEPTAYETAGTDGFNVTGARELG